MTTSAFDGWQAALLANVSDLLLHFADFSATPCETGQQLTDAMQSWNNGHQSKIGDLLRQAMAPAGETPPPANSGPFFDGTPCMLVATAKLPALDLSGLAVHPGGNLWALNESPGKLFEVTRDGAHVLRTITLKSANPIDLEGLAFVRSDNDHDTFAVFSTAAGHRKLIIFTVSTSATSVDLDAATSYATTKTWEALAYEPDADTFHLWHDRDYTRFVPNGSSGYTEQFQWDPKFKPAPRNAESLDFNADASPHLFHWTQLGVCKEVNKDTGVVVSQFNFAKMPGWVAMKWEGMAIEAGTKSVFIVSESSSGQVNFQRWEQTS